MMRPQHILERFHVNQNSAGARDWLALTYRYAAGEQISVIVQDLARKANRPSAAIYARMKRALAPVLNANVLQLRAVGIDLPERTTTALARACAKLC